MPKPLHPMESRKVTLPKTLWLFIREVRESMEMHGSDSLIIQHCVHEKRVAVYAARAAALKASAAA